MSTLSLIVDWYGPFDSIEDASEAAIEMGFEESLYMALGRRRHQRNADLQYIGITKNPGKRLVNHHKLNQITGDLKLWWGEISSHGIAGRPGKKRPIRHSVALTNAERVIAYFLSLPLNEQLRRSPPSASIVILNRWFNPQGKRRSHRGSANWPDMIEFDQEGDEAMALRLWFGTPGKRHRLSASDIEEIANA